MSVPPETMTAAWMQTAPIRLVDITVLVRKDLLEMVARVQVHWFPQDEITCFRISETWRKHAISCFRYIYVSRKRENSSATLFRHVSGTEIPSHVFKSSKAELITVVPELMPNFKRWVWSSFLFKDIDECNPRQTRICYIFSGLSHFKSCVETNFPIIICYRILAKRLSCWDVCKKSSAEIISACKIPPIITMRGQYFSTEIFAPFQFVPGRVKTGDYNN